MDLVLLRMWAMAITLPLLLPCQATFWTVGDSHGWNLAVNYSQWLQGKTFKLGDVLFFSYNQSKHSVLEVSEADQATCTTADPIASYTSGNTSITLGNASTHYYICGIPGHCLDGMTLVIKISNGSTPAPIPAPAPSFSTPNSSPESSFTPSPASQSPGTPAGSLPPLLPPNPSHAAFHKSRFLLAFGGAFLICSIL